MKVLQIYELNLATATSIIQRCDCRQFVEVEKSYTKIAPMYLFGRRTTRRRNCGPLGRTTHVVHPQARCGCIFSHVSEFEKREQGEGEFRRMGWLEIPLWRSELLALAIHERHY